MPRLPNDLDDVAVSKFGAERGHPIVDLGAHAGVAHLRMDRICKIHRRCIARERNDLAFRREGIDFLRVEIDFQRAQEIGRILHLLLQFYKMP